MNENYDDTFLARWISGELSSEELEAFKKSKYYLDYKKINEGAQALEAPSFDRQKLLSQIQAELTSSNNNKPIRRIPNWTYGIAASVLIALGVFFFINPKTELYETGFGEQQVVTLPDNSKVYLNSKSTLSYTKNNWEDNRLLTLNGEGFFDVEKGKTFKVITSEGTVEVLGTEFNVIANTNYFEVECHEGRVKISHKLNDEHLELNAGDGFRTHKNLIESWTLIEDKPQWISGESTFKNTPINQVIIALKNQYNIEFNSHDIDLNKRFTGSFTHKDLKLALKTVFAPLDITYTITTNDIIALDQN